MKRKNQTNGVRYYDATKVRIFVPQINLTMKKEDLIPPVEGIQMFAEPIEGETQWMVYVQNLREEALDTVLISSTSYDELGIEQTVTLRHQIGQLLPQEIKPVERLDPTTFHLKNEYWFSGWLGTILLDHPFCFPAHSLSGANTRIQAK